MASTATTHGAPQRTRVQVQKFGTFLSNMVMPNIGAFIAWGLITAMFIEVGWLNLGGKRPRLAQPVTAGSPTSAGGATTPTAAASSAR